MHFYATASTSKFMRHLPGLAAGLVLLFTAIGFVILDFHSDEQRFVRNVKSAIQQNKNKVLIADLTDFDWSRVCLFGYYAAPKVFTDKEIRHLDDTNRLDFEWLGSDLTWGLVFVRSDGSTLGLPVSKIRLDNRGPPKEGEIRSQCSSRESASLMLFKRSGDIVAIFTTD